MSSQARKLQGKVAVVTASTDGIGLAIARRLGQDGARVMVSSRKQKNVDSAVETLRSENLDVSGTTCHVAKSEDRVRLIEETVKRFGGIDILVSNAAVNPVFGPMMDTTVESWDKVFDVNLKSTFFLCKEAVPHMQKRGCGSIILISSLAAYAPNPLLGAYSVSKTAMNGLGKAMALELAPSKIRVNTVCPGLIKTRFSTALWNNEAAKEVSMQGIPLKRLGLPTDCSGIVSFLACEEDSGYVTGEAIVVAGGSQSRL